MPRPLDDSADRQTRGHLKCILAPFLAKGTVFAPKSAAYLLDKLHL
jgi:hypothetical protein